MKYEFDAINVGDIITVKGPVVRKYSHCMEIKTSENTLQVIAVEEISDHLPVPFKVGDKIRHKSLAARGEAVVLTVVSVDGAEVWAKRPDGTNSTLTAANFEIAPASHIAATTATAAAAQAWLKAAA